MITTETEARKLEAQERLEEDLAPLSDDDALRRRVERQLRKRGEFRQHVAVFVAVNVLLLALFVAIGIPWVSAVIALSWGSGLAAHAIEVYFDSGKRAATRLARIHQAFRDSYGPRWHENATQAQLVRVRERVDGPVTKRRELLQHAAVYTAINAMLWFVYATIMPGGFPWPLFVSGFWGLGLAGHVVEVRGKPQTDRDVEREVERQRALIEQAQWGDEKPKNDFLVDEEPTLTVGPDGELVELADEDDAPLLKRKRS